MHSSLFDSALPWAQVAQRPVVGASIFVSADFSAVVTMVQKLRKLQQHAALTSASSHFLWFVSCSGNCTSMTSGLQRQRLDDGVWAAAELLLLRALHQLGWSTTADCSVRDMGRGHGLSVTQLYNYSPPTLFPWYTGVLLLHK